MEHNNSRTITLSIKVTPSEKIRYKDLAESHNVSLSEWGASILNMYQHAYGELRINSIREEELLNEIDKLEKEINLLKATKSFQDTLLESNALGLRLKSKYSSSV